jgi:hypothetical protein
LRVELGVEKNKGGVGHWQEYGHGEWFWRCAEYGVEGHSREPLLDACRKIKRMGGALQRRVGLFREGRDQPDLSCTVEAGAGLTVNDDGPRFQKWKPRPMGQWHLKGTNESD